MIFHAIIRKLLPPRQYPDIRVSNQPNPGFSSICREKTRVRRPVNRTQHSLQNPTPAPVAPAAPTTTSTAVLTARATSTATATTGRALFAGPGDVHGQITTIQGSPVHRLDGLLCLFGRSHCYERKAARASAHAVHHQVCLDHRAMRGERVMQVVFRGVVGEISHKQLRTHMMLICPRLSVPLSKLFPTAGFQIITEARSTEDLP